MNDEELKDLLIKLLRKEVIDALMAGVWPPGLAEMHLRTMGMKEVADGVWSW